jgi:chorismate mutase
MRKKGRSVAAFIVASLLACQTATAASHPEQLQPLVRDSAKRIAVAREVALAKWDSGTPVEDVERENQVIETAVVTAKKRGLSEKFVASFFRAQIEANKTVQYGLLAQWYRDGKAPSHAQINLKETIRPKLDELQTRLLDDLGGTSAIRRSDDCHAETAVAVGVYLKSEGREMSALESVALDRSLSTFCTR